MQLDDDLCLCFHVSQRKILKFIRLEKPRRVSQLSECYGAGTGCGWCRPFLRKLFEQADAGDAELSPQQYAEHRQRYLDQKRSES